MSIRKIALMLTTTALLSPTIGMAQNVDAHFYIAADLDPVSSVFTVNALTAGTVPDKEIVGTVTTTKTSNNTPSGIAIRWTRAMGSASEASKQKLFGSTSTANTLNVLLDDVIELGQERWLDHPAKEQDVSSTSFNIVLDGVQTVVADTYDMSLDTASYTN